MKLRFQLILLLLLISLFISVTISILFYQNQKLVLRSYVDNQLRSISKTKEIRIQYIIKAQKELIGIPANNLLLVKGLNNYLNNPGKEHQFEISQLLNSYKQSIPSFEEGYVLADNGNVVASTDSTVIGKNWSSYTNFKVSVTGRKFLDAIHFDEKNQLNIFLSAPIYFDDKIIGVIIMSRIAEDLFSLTNDYTGLGSTGETYLGKRQGDSVVYLNPLRFDKNAALKKSFPINDSSYAMGKIINAKRDTLLEIKDYKGNDAITALNYFPETGWGMVTKFGYEEAMEPIILLRDHLLLFNGIVIVIVVVFASILSSSLVRPIEVLTSTANKFSEGDFSQLSGIKSKDEIGILAHSFNTMAKRLQRKIAKSDTMFSTVFESVEEGITLFKVIRDSSGQIIDFEWVLVNRWAEKLLNRTRTDLIGKRWMEEYPIIKDLGVFDMQVKVIETGETINTDFFFLNEWFKNKLIKISDDELLTTFDSITQQKESNIQTENLHSIFLQSQALGRIGSYELNFQNKKLTLTPEMSEILCTDTLKNEGAISMDRHPFVEFIHPDDKEKANETIRKAVYDHKPYSVEYKLLCSGNVVKYVWSQGKVFYDKKDEPIKMIGTVLDISEWKKNQREIQERKVLLSRAENLANLGSYEYDIENGKTTWSDHLFKIYGYEPNEFEPTEKTFLKVVHPDDKEYVKKVFSERIFKEDAFDYQFNFVKKDHSVGVIYGKVNVIRNNNNQATKVTGFVQDITERVKRLQELKTLNAELESRVNERTKELTVSIVNLKKLNASLDNYAYVISHDLRAPLAAIEGLIPFVKGDYEHKPLDKEGKEMLDMIIEKIKDMKNIMENVLKTAKMQKQDKEQVNLFHVCQEVLTTLSPPSHFHIHISNTLPIINFNKTSLKQIIQNLIGNAIKYTDKKNPVIKIDAVEMDEEYQISVYDNGSGIPEDKLPKIFERFEIAHTRKNVDSHGIGLSIVKQFVEANGGKVWVESELGKETTFYFTIPK